MTNELARWADPTGRRLVPSKEDREQARAVASLRRETQFQGLRIDAEAALAGRIMERTLDVDDYRKALANGDPVLDAVLTRIEVNFVDRAARLQRTFGSESL